MIQRLRNRIARSEAQGGFTLIELLVVIIIIGILLAVAVPSYLGFRDRANTSAAKANVRAAVPSVEAFYADNGTYVGMSLAALQAIDPSVKVAVDSSPAPTASTYCIENTSPTTPVYHKSNPAGDIVAGACP
jgi:type IV pilus assembly protein PilA